MQQCCQLHYLKIAFPFLLPRHLYEVGTDVNSPNEDSHTPLHLAIFLCHCDIIRYDRCHRALHILTQASSVLGEVEADFSAAGGRTIVDDAIEYARCSKRPAKIMEAVRCVRVRLHAAADTIVR